MLLSCASRDLIVRNVHDQLFDTTTEVGAELVQHLPPIAIAHQTSPALVEQDTVTAAATTSGPVRRVFREGQKQRTVGSLLGGIDDVAFPEDHAQHSIAHDGEEEEEGDRFVWRLPIYQPPNRQPRLPPDRAKNLK